MKSRLGRIYLIAALFAILSFGLWITPGIAHHSFAMYDQGKTLTFTGVATRFVAQARATARVAEGLPIPAATSP